MTDTTPLAIVTGATSGIGGAIARRLCREGARVVVTGRDEARARDVAASIERDEGAGSCLGLALDVTRGESVDAFARALESEGPATWLVNNAGVAETAPALSDENPALLRRLMEINVHGPLRLFHAFAPAMVERGDGAVVQIASSASLVGYPYVSAYAASKHALLGWTRSVALECAPKGVAVSAVCPHYVDTPMTERSIANMREKSGRSEADLREFLASQNPGGVLISPNEVADAALELLRSDRTGRVIELIGDGERVVEEGISVRRSKGGA